MCDNIIYKYASLELHKKLLQLRVIMQEINSQDFFNAFFGRYINKFSFCIFRWTIYHLSNAVCVWISEGNLLLKQINNIEFQLEIELILSMLSDFLLFLNLI